MTEASLKQSVITTYRKRAGRYDFTSSLYHLIGFRIGAYRRQAVSALNLQRGDTVVEIGCGTGLNFPLLQQAVGPSGKVIGVDMTDAMLNQARQRVEDNGWTNVELVQGDAVAYSFPAGVDGILSTFALSLAPELDTIIHNGCVALAPGKRWVILDLKVPSFWTPWLTTLLLPIVRPFAVTEELIDQRPWDVIRKVMERYLTNTSWRELYLGFGFIAAGERSEAGC